MIKLNSLQYPNVLDLDFGEEITMQPLKNNEIIETEIKKFSLEFGFNKLRTFKFNSSGILSLFLNLKGKILVSLGESEPIIEAAKKYKSLGFEIDFIPLTKEGDLDYKMIEKCDYIFASSYVMDTYLKIDLEKVKSLSDAILISNITATLNPNISDIVILDTYKLTGYSLDSILLYNEGFEDAVNSQICTASIFQIKKSIENFSMKTQYKDIFMERLNDEFKANIFYFVKPNKCLEYTLHFGLKNIKAREIIRTMSLDSIFITNGEGCSVGLSKPSRILQEMGYKEIESRWALSLNFSEDLDEETIKKVVKTLGKKYRQIIALNS